MGNTSEYMTISGAAAFHKAVSSASKTCIVTHTHPDGDALGSSLGLMGWLDMEGKNSTIILPDSEPSSLIFMVKGTAPGRIIRAIEDMDAAQRTIAEADLIICVDMNSFHRAESIEEYLVQSKAFKILADHHIGPDESSFDIVMSYPDLSSASELVFWLLMQMPGIDGDAAALPELTADSLMTGMTTDTNNFNNSAVPSTFSMASKLIAAGVDRERILAEIGNRYREERIRLMGHMLGQMMEITPEGASIMILDKNTQEQFSIRNGETEGFVNMPLAMDKVKVSVFLKEEGDRFRVSIRSKKGYSARTLAMNWFDGGGHEQASGGKLPLEKAADASAAMEYVRKATKDLLG